MRLCFESGRFSRSGAALAAALLLWGGVPGPASASSLTDRLGLSVFSGHESAPEMTAPNLAGRTIRLSDFRGKVVLLNFWATWCEPCRKEIPSLLSLEKALLGRPFVVVSVAMDRHLDHIAPFVRKYAISYPVLEGRKGSIDSRYYGMGLPQTYIIDRKGLFVGRATGGRDWASPDAVSYLRSMTGPSVVPVVPPGGNQEKKEAL